MLIKIHPDNPSPRQIKRVVETLENGGIIIYPTDSVYALGCSLLHPKSIEKLARIKQINPEKAMFSFIFSNLTHLSNYTKPIDNTIFKLIKKTTPGPFTFILEANNRMPKIVKGRKKTVGIRIPDNNIALAIVEELGHPLITSSVHDEDDIIEYMTDPEMMYEKYQYDIDLLVDGGYGDNRASTVIDCTDGRITLLRQGKGNIDDYVYTE
ncbi:MAG: L-threonylcarbamoyladenylate synthase [Bacteroidales bacterium]|nr:L-threonylcarbamoyladenylate synthase [Bacteroidales bacterium]